MRAAVAAAPAAPIAETTAAPRMVPKPPHPIEVATAAANDIATLAGALACISGSLLGYGRALEEEKRK